MLHIYAAVAQKERSLIAARTSEALQAAKRRGVKLGRAGKQRAKENKAAADAQAKTLGPTIRELRAAGITSVRAIAGVEQTEGANCQGGRMARHIRR